MFFKACFFPLCALLTGLKWAGLRWKKLMSRISVYQSDLATFESMSTGLYLYLCQSNLVKSHPQIPDEAYLLSF